MTETIYGQYKKIIFPLAAVIFLFFGVEGVFAQTQSASDSAETAQKYGVTFPVAELGDCQDISSCRSFCEDPVNYTTCIDFAKKKGFYKEEQETVKKDEILAKAKQTFGCNSFESCKSYCDKPEHVDECDSFARKNNLVGGQVRSTEEKKILEKAKEALGCTSPQDCMTFCGLEANKQKCSEFAKEVGLRGGQQQVGPGGCSSEGTCKAFCSDPANYNICSSYSKSVGVESFSGPGGCNTAESCAAYCRQNPEKCRSISQNREGGSNYTPQEYCARTPNCAWNNNTCACGSYGGNVYTQACPANYYYGPGGVCTPLDKSQDAWRCSQAGRYWDGGSCRDSSPEGTTGNYNPQDMCNRTTNCKWTNNSCACAFNGEIKTYTPGSQDGYYGSKESQESTCKSGGGTCDWSSGHCYCKGYQSPISGGAPGASYSPYPGTSSYPSSSGYYGSRESQESTCRSGGGTCDWSPGYCRCAGYNSSGTTSGGSYATPYPYSSSGYSSDPATACGQAGGSWNGSYCQMPSGSTSNSTSTTTSTMSRDQQQAGCTSCGGSCNWSGDYCQCQCASSGSTSNSTPAPTTSSSTPAPDQSTPAPQQSTPAPSVQGVSVSAGRDFLQIIWDFFFSR